MRIMMSAAGSPVAPSIMRHLRDLGHDVIGHDCNGYADLRSPPIEAGASYMALIKETAHDLYLPFLDEELDLFSTYGIPQTAFCSSRYRLMVFTDKLVQHAVLEENGFDVPRATIDGDVIAKPRMGRGSKGIIRTTNPRVALLLRESGSYLVQSFIKGDEYTIDTLTNKEGDFIFAVPRKRLQVNSVSTVGQIDMDRNLIKLAKDLVNSFEFNGPINIQVIRDERGKDHIIEVNARLSGSCIFSVMGGFDILGATIKLWQNQSVAPSFNVRDGLIIKRHYIEREICGS